jgi:hypothetical protein
LNCFLEYFIREFEKTKIKEEILAEKGIKIQYKSKNTTIRYLPNNLECKITTGITKDKIVLIICYEQFPAIVIKGENVARTHKSYFELLWKTAKKS